MKFMDVVREIAKEERKYFENYIYYAKLIKEKAKELLGEAEVYVFGSVVEGKHTPASDIDVLVVSKNMPKKQSERGRIRAEILKSIDVFAPFEIHLANEKEFEWYRRFVKNFVKV
ncbi:DNA polymerase beta domain protein region [Ferroglobus placidus DSM 10642]|uniref:DNA polymerase beta domain protein region n=1 Tax=Ferroglobus placidus (strain DSM 10642 / AEDII12DO) TaxID=589924 RepID=D3RXK4_FERPA|nr:nucleotidyltransferase domain-containing protein [Ferroglobus placidus]ADC65217.1 DNA polymerase beta domain protein region [Ferroglobus placidus DSM 10642]